MKSVKTYLLFGFFLLGTVGAICAQSTFELRIGGGETERGEEVLQTLDGGYLVIGHGVPDGRTDADMFLVKTDGQGAVQWDRYIGGTGRDQGHALVMASQGDYVLVGEYEQSPGNPDAYMVRVNMQGDTLWTLKVGGTDRDALISVIQSQDGNFIAAGYTRSFGSGREALLLMKVSPNGQLIWQQNLGPAGFWKGEELVEGPDGSLYIVGSETDVGLINRNALLVKTDSIGQFLWAQTYDWNQKDYGQGLILHPDGSLVLVGSSIFIYPYFSTLNLVKVDSLGQVQWRQQYGGGDFELGTGIIRLAGGGYMLVGTTSAPGLHFDDHEVWMIRTDAQGDSLWSRHFGYSESDFGKHMIQTSDGGFVICGSAANVVDLVPDLFFIKTDGMGMTRRETDQIEASITLFPNPTTGLLRFEQSVEEVWVHDLEGKVLLRVDGPVRSVDLSKLEAGMVLVEVIVEGVRMVEQVRLVR